MKHFARFIKNNDGYGQNLILNINGDETVKSFCGGICYLIDLICLFGILLINFYNFFFFPDPLITVSEIFRSQNDIEKISAENLMFSNFFVKINQTGKPRPIVSTPYISNSSEINLKYNNGTVKMNLNFFGNFGDCESNRIYLKNKKFKPIYNRLKNYSKEKFLTCFDVTKDHFSIGGNILSSDESSRAEIYSSYEICDFLNKEKNCSTNLNEIKDN